jgi:hypothetical protein
MAALFVSGDNPTTSYTSMNDGKYSLRRFMSDQQASLGEGDVCLLLALNGPTSRDYQWLLIGVKQTQCGHAATSESDPKRTFDETDRQEVVFFGTRKKFSISRRSFSIGPERCAHET